jgi:hypothetical protein
MLLFIAKFLLLALFILTKVCTTSSLHSHKPSLCVREPSLLSFPDGSREEREGKVIADQGKGEKIKI